MNPKAFKIIDGKLYLNWDTESAGDFEKNATANIEKADASWKKLKKQQ